MKLKIFIGSLFFLLAATACGVNINLGDRPSVNASGKRVSETRAVSGFDEVLLAGSGELYIEQSGEETLSVEADDNVLPYVKTEVEGDTLVLGFKEGAPVALSRPVVFRLTVRDLTSLSLAGSGKIEAKGLETDKLTLSLPGSGDITLESLDAARLHVTLAGSGNIEIQDGTADSEEINLLGSGNFKGAEFQVQDASATIAGSGSIALYASGKLDAKILGSGTIDYSGEPQSVEVDSAGSGKIRQVK